MFVASRSAGQPITAFIEYAYRIWIIATNNRIDRTTFKRDPMETYRDASVEPSKR